MKRIYYSLQYRNSTHRKAGSPPAFLLYLSHFSDFWHGKKERVKIGYTPIFTPIIFLFVSDVLEN